MQDLERDSHEKYNKGLAYDAATITHSLRADSNGYSHNLLAIKAALLSPLVGSSRVLDIGCADGRHLAELSETFAHGIGLDFSERFISAAKEAYGNIHNTEFMVGDARNMQIPSQSVDVAYSFATLYHVNDIAGVYAEIARVLAPSGVAVLEVGNARSLATLVSRRPENQNLAQHSGRTIGDHLGALKDAKLELVTHRSFQLLPMWGNLDGLMSILRKPALDRLMAKQVKGRMIDEWISSLPLLRNFAFRHLIVCRKDGHMDRVA